MRSPAAGVAGLAVVAACGFHHGAAPAGDAPDDGADAPAVPMTASLFVADYGAGQFLRFDVAPATSPATPVVVALPDALSPVWLPTGDLLVGELSSATIARFSTPLDTPAFVSAFTGDGLSTNIAKMIVVDDEVWLVNAGGTDVDRLAFDAHGTATMTGSLAIANGRGLVFDASSRELFASECCGTDTVLHYAVATDHSVTALAAITGNGLMNPHGLLVTPWGELLVSDAGANEILRFTRAEGGTLTAAGTITGNGLATPIDLAMAPWGELFVTNQGTGTVSRFLFDDTPAHAASEHGFFAVPGEMSIAWMALVPTSPR